MKYKIIGFAGPAGCGKNTASQMVRSIATMRFHPCEEHYFAQPIYDMLEAGGFGRPKTQEEKIAVIPGHNFSWRKAAQLLGTEWGRGLSPTIWRDITASKIKTSPAALHLITDVRFENEAELIREMGGVVWHLHGRRVALQGLESHASEVPLPFAEGDKVISNSGSAQWLETQVRRLLDDAGVLN